MYIKFNDICVKDCPFGYYLNSDKCSVCSNDCGHCYGPKNSQCLSCKSTKKLFNNTCINACPDNYKDKKGFGKCELDLCPITRRSGICVN